MPLLSGNTTELFGIRLSGTSTVSWAISAISQLDQRTENVSAQGTTYAAGVTPIVTSLDGQVHGPSSRDLQFFSAINNGLAPITVTLGKVVTLPGAPTTFFQFSPPTVLDIGQTFTYVRGAGFVVYDAIGRPQTSSAHS